ncbi:hypothetical protein C8J56DRAFT_881252 [Mycena floridula]|nr:hypothetical protein C8J56DRAFT_881252 [Mycena floridula]
MHFATSSLLSIVSVMLLTVHAIPMNQNPAVAAGGQAGAAPHAPCTFKGVSAAASCDVVACSAWKRCEWKNSRCGFASLQDASQEPAKTNMANACRNCQCRQDK